MQKPTTLATLVLMTVLITPAVAVPADAPLLFVTIETDSILAREPIEAELRGSFADGSATAVPISVRAQEPIGASLVLPTGATTGEWSVLLVTNSGSTPLEVRGELSGSGIQILASRVDSDVIELPRDTTSLRISHGYVSANVTLTGNLKQSGCCDVTFGIDADTDGNITSSESRTVRVAGTDVAVTLHLERAAPTVPYSFSIVADSGQVVARSTGMYSFLRLNSVSATGEFDPDFVEFVTARVERVPHLVTHEIGSNLLLQHIEGNARSEDGPRVFFTMGTPSDPQVTPDSETESNASGERVRGADSPLDELAKKISGRLVVTVLAVSLIAIVVAALVRRRMDQ